MIVLPLLALLFASAHANYHCSNQAKLTIVESIPEQLNLYSANSTFDAWRYLARKARYTLDIAAFYVRLRGGENYPSIAGGWQGAAFFQDVIDAVQRGVKVRLVQNEPSAQFPDTDSAAWAKAGVEVRSIDWPSLQPTNSGILHTKMIVVDSDDFYLGSANMDWTALTEVKELGVVVEKCELLAQDATKMMIMYWEAAHMTQIPSQWPAALDTTFNRTHPAHAILNNEPIQMFLSASPDNFDTPNRAHDGDTLVANIDDATSSVDVEVMDYYPFSMFFAKNFYWDNIDAALRRAAFRGVQVRLLFGKWEHTPNSSLPYWYSLNALDNITVREFVVPPLKGSPAIPFSRVNHAKYIVTDKLVYVDTSNFTPDYFISTGGLGWTMFSQGIRDQVQAKFDRDWNSQYAHDLP